MARDDNAQKHQDIHAPFAETLVGGEGSSADGGAIAPTLLPGGFVDAGDTVAPEGGGAEQALAWSELKDISTEQQGRYGGEQRELGRGGMGRVVLGVDQHLKRQVAIKELLTDSLENTHNPTQASVRRQRAEARFVREARITGMLEHPGVVPVHELARRDDGTIYYTMKCVRGKTLREALAETKTLGERLRLLGHFTRLCQAVAYAHSQGVLHRDLKPDNVMIGEFGETVVLDWGLAKLVGERLGSAQDPIAQMNSLFNQASTARTLEGVPIGTPAYMSPEQAEGKLDEIDARSDVWGLGAVLYEILTGGPPFEGESAMQVVMRVASQPVVPVAERQPNAPPELIAITQKALQRDRNARYADAGALCADVEAYQEGRLVGSFTYSAWDLARRFVARNKALSAAMALSLALILVFSVVLFFAYSATDAAREAAELANARELEERLRAQRSERDAHLVLSLAHAAAARQFLNEHKYLQASMHIALALVESPFHPLGPHRDLPNLRTPPN